MATNGKDLDGAAVPMLKVECAQTADQNDNITTIENAPGLITEAEGQATAARIGSARSRNSSGM